MVMLLQDVTLRKGVTSTPGGWCKSAAFRSHSEGQTLLHSGLRAQLEKDFQKWDKDLQSVCSHNKTSFPSWIPCAWEKACGYLPSICTLIAFIYGCVIVWWPFFFFLAVTMTFLLQYKPGAVSMREFQVIFTAQWSRTLGRLPARMSLLAHGGAGSSSAATHADIHVFKHRKLFQGWAWAITSLSVGSW